MWIPTVVSEGGVYFLFKMLSYIFCVCVYVFVKQKETFSTPVLWPFTV